MAPTLLSIDCRMETTRPARRHAAGFTLLEVLVVVAIVLVAATILVPAIQNLLHRSQVEGFVRNAAIFMQMGRAEAIKQGLRAVAEVRPADAEFLIFIDFDEDGEFAPVAGAARGQTDAIIWRQSLPASVVFEAPDGVLADGFSEGPDGQRQAIFLPEGSIDESGAFRLGDGRGNFFEIRVEPRATARVQLRKWHEGEERFLAAGEDPGWRWY